MIIESVLSGAKSIGYVTPYRAQATLMDKLISELLSEQKEVDLLAATVHRFQGSERECMIFDTVDAFPVERPGYLLNGKESERLINVALTRSKGKLIQVSHSSFFRDKMNPNQTLRQLLAHQEKHSQRIGREKIGSWINHQHPKLQWLYARDLTKVTEDLRGANVSIVLSLSHSTPVLSEWILILSERRAPLTLISDGSFPELKPENCVHQAFPFNFILIDKQILWLGLPLSNTTHIKPPHIAARLECSQVVEHFLKQLQLE